MQRRGIRIGELFGDGRRQQRRLGDSQ